MTISSIFSPGLSIGSVKDLPERLLSIPRWLNAKRNEEMAVATTKNFESLFMGFSFGCSLDKKRQKLNRSGKTGHRQINSLQSPSTSLKPGGAMTWSVCIQTKPVVTAIAKMTNSPVRSTRRIGNTLGETDVFVDMAYSFL